MTQKRNLNWAVLGTGVIAKEMAEALAAMGRTFYGVGNRTYENAVAFGEKYHVTKVFPDYDSVLEDPNVDIVYITTPHNTHHEYMKKALEHDKHIFVEKSITLNLKELDEMIALADRKGKIIAEAMTIWHMPLYKKLKEIIDSGELGKVQMITANFGSFKEYDMSSRFFNPDLAGGAMLDIGVYALSMIRNFMSSKPTEIVSQMKLAPTGVDEQATILLTNPEGQMAAAALTLHSKQPKRTMISCEKAYIEIMEYPRADKAVIVDAVTGARREILAGSTPDALQYEVRDVEHAILTQDISVLRLSDSHDVMEIMTRLRKEWNIKYPGEIWS